MPILTAADIAANVPWQLASLPRKLNELGIPVPERLHEGLTRARWKVPTPDLSDAKAAVRAAKTEDEFRAAVVTYAEGLVVQRAMGTDEVIQATLAEFSREAAGTALRDVKDEIIVSLQTAFLDTAQDFVAEVQFVPETTPLDVFSIEPDVANHLRDARVAAKRLTEIVAVINQIHEITHPGKRIVTRPNDLIAADRTVRAVADFDDPGAATKAAKLIVDYAVRDITGAFAELSPWAQIVKFGGTFKAPDQVDEIVHGAPDDDDAHWTLP